MYQSNISRISDVVHTWVNAQDGLFPEGAFEAAVQQDGEPLFVARATIEGAHVIGTLNPKLSFAQLPYGGNGQEMNRYEVLVFNSESPPVEWVAAQNGDLPEGALLAGREANGQSLYVVKASVANQVLIGKLNPSHGKAYVPHNGRELVVTSYEVLVSNSCEVPVSNSATGPTSAAASGTGAPPATG